MTDPDDVHELVLQSAAIKAIENELPEAVAAAVIEFVTGALIGNPWRVGKRLRGDLVGVYSARRGTYRVLYEIDEEQHVVNVLRIDHRRDAYRAV